MATLKKIFLFLFSFCCGSSAFSQETAPVNGVSETRTNSYAFTHATIVKDASTVLTDATLLIKKGKIVAVGTGINIPADAVLIDCTGKYIYPSFIDIYSDYGVPIPVRQGGFNFNQPSQITSNTKGAFGWNQAIKPEVNAAVLFTADDAKAKTLRESGFGVVLTHQKDGIARGTGSVVDLSDNNEKLSMIREKASANYSFNRGTSTQSYPQSLMGSIALLRQTFLDAQWYKNTHPASEGTNLSLQAWNNNLSLPQIFEANDKWNDLRADRVGDEFGVQFIIKAGQNEYQRIEEMKATKAAFILPLNFPAVIDVEDPNDTRFVSLADLKQWEMAPSNPAAFEKAGITFCITAADLRDTKQFMPNLRKAIQYGLSEKAALDALTKIPAQLLNVYNETGSIDNGKLADFIITNGPVFAEKTSILQNWVQGEKYGVKDDGGIDTRGHYNLTIVSPAGNRNFSLDVKDNSSADLVGTDTVSTKYSNDGKTVKLSFGETRRARKGYRLSGINNGNQWNGAGTDSSGNAVIWTADFASAIAAKSDSVKKINPVTMGTLTYPNMAYGYKEIPKQETMLIKNTTVWTNEKEGIVTGEDVLVENGKISAVGKNLNSANARVIDGTGKTPYAGHH